MLCKLALVGLASFAAIRRESRSRAAKVAEQFRVLDALAPGRIDLGLGRAPGSDGLTAFALNPNAAERPHQFPNDVMDLDAWLHGEELPCFEIYS